jgi:hypothetical protein
MVRCRGVPAGLRGRRGYKGKTVHPANWGQFAQDSDMNVDLQEAALASYKKRNKKKKARSARSASPALQAELEQKQEEIERLKAEIHTMRSRSGSVFQPKVNTLHGASNEWSKLPNALKPTTQLNADSFLGRALLSRKHNPCGRKAAQASDGSSSPSDSPDEDVSSSERASTLKEKSRRKKRHERMIIKPVPPEVYDGSPNTRIFHKFVLEATNYVKDGRVRKRRQVSMMMRYLTGNAYEFYVRKVAYNPED